MIFSCHLAIRQTSIWVWSNMFGALGQHWKWHDHCSCRKIKCCDTCVYKGLRWPQRKSDLFCFRGRNLFSKLQNYSQLLFLRKKVFFPQLPLHPHVKTLRIAFWWCDESWWGRGGSLVLLASICRGMVVEEFSSSHKSWDRSGWLIFRNLCKLGVRIPW